MKKVSVIIPVFEEQEQHVRKLVSHIRTTSLGADYEILLVYCGKPKHVFEAARFSNVRLVLVAEQDKSALLNRGASEASGGVLFFLHPECRSPVAAVHMIVSQIKKGAHAGNFCLKYNGKNPLLWLIAWFTRFHQGMFYGGRRGFFVARRWFRSAGGFPVHAADPHRQLVKKLRSSGARFRLVRDYVTTSDLSWFSQAIGRQAWTAQFHQAAGRLWNILWGQRLHSGERAELDTEASFICKEIDLKSSRNTTG